MKNKITQDYLNRIVDAAEQYSSHIYRDHKLANAQFKTLLLNIEGIAKSDVNGLDLLVPLLNHQDVRVRTIIACFTLKHETEHSIRVLKEASLEPRGLAMLAITALEKWKRGIYFDPIECMDIKIE